MLVLGTAKLRINFIYDFLTFYLEKLKFSPSTIEFEEKWKKSQEDLNQSEKEIIEEEDLPDPEPPNTIPEQQFVKNTLKWFVYIIIIPALLLIFWYVYKTYIYPKAIKPLWLAIERLLGKDPEVQAFEQAAYKRYRDKAEAAAKARLENNIQ